MWAIFMPQPSSGSLRLDTPKCGPVREWSSLVINLLFQTGFLTKYPSGPLLRLDFPNNEIRDSIEHDLCAMAFCPSAILKGRSAEEESAGRNDVRGGYLQHGVVVTNPVPVVPARCTAPATAVGRCQVGSQEGERNHREQHKLEGHLFWM